MKELVGVIERDGNRKGTAFLISKDIILTAKHVVISPAESIGDIEEVNLVFRYKDEIINGKTINLKTAIDKNIDVVFVELEEILSQDDINVLSVSDNDLTDFDCEITGYPQISTNVYELQGEICNSSSEYEIKVTSNHGLQNFDGISGSPVSVQGRVVGIAVRQNADNITAISISEIQKILGFEGIKFNIEHFEKRYTDIGFDKSKINSKTLEAIASVGPRYSKIFNVNTSSYSKLWSILDKNSTKSFFVMVSNYLQETIRFLDNSFSYLKENNDLLQTSNQEDLKTLYSLIRNTISKLESKSFDVFQIVDSLKEHSDNMQRVIDEEIQRFERIYGKHSFHNMSWRGYMASYMCSFPTQYIDELIEAKKNIEEVITLLYERDNNELDDKMILVTGKGGIGKTHLLCDISSKIIEKGAIALLTLGEYFQSSVNPLSTISFLYSGQEDYSKFLFEINSEGRKKDVLIPICIDAINEMPDNKYWNLWLPAVIEEIKKYNNLVLIISCRTIYLKEYLDDTLKKSFYLIDHNGFEQNRIEAINKFCEYYNVSIDYASANIPEFINPLMLKMLCEIASEQNDRNVEVDDLKTLMDKFIYIKNKKITCKYSDYFSINDKIVYKVMNAISNVMSANYSLSISWEELRVCVNSLLNEYGIAEKTSGFIKELVSENLLREYEFGENAFSYGYQRFYEHSFAAQLLNISFEDLIKLIDGQKVSLGTLEMLQILYFREKGHELIKQIPDKMFNELLRAFVSGLYWRKKEDYGKDTFDVVRKVFRGSNEDNIELMIDGLLEISTKSNSCLNALFIHSSLSKMTPLKRDYFLSFFLLKKYEQRYIIKDLCERAINLTKDTISKDVSTLWKIILCWGTGINDIKLRDSASKALCNLINVSNEDTIFILHLFENVDDDYIQERLYQAIYSSIVLNEDEKLASSFREYLKEKYSSKELFPQNVLVRYYMRDVFEYSYKMGWCEEKDVILFRPPYCSKLHEIDEKFVEASKEEAKDLLWDCLESDYARYTIPHEVEDYGFTQHDVGKLVFEDMIKYGYINSPAFEYDKYINYTYGSLRSRDVEVERIGKKYQKIFLYREMGNVYDNGKYAPRFGCQDSGSLIPEQGREFREIDLMRLPGKNTFEGNKLLYPFYRYAKWDNVKWFSHDDIDKYLDNLFFSSREKKYMVLKAYLSDKEKDKEAFREIWMHFNTYIYEKKNENELLLWLKGKDFEGRWMPEGFSQMYEQCIGEYPWSPGVNSYLEEALNDWRYDSRGKEDLPCRLFTTVNEYLDEKDSEFFREKNSTVMYPSEYWYSKMDIHWDGRYSFYVDDSIAFKNAADNILYIDFEFLKRFLARNNSGIILTVLGEKQFIGSGFGLDFPGRSEFSISYYLEGNLLKRVDKIYNVQMPSS